MIRYLLDTNTISELARKRPDANVQTWFVRQKTKQLYLSSFTVAEIEMGIAQHPDASKAERLRNWLEGSILPNFSQRILGFDLAAARVYGRWAGLARKTGRSLPVVDSQIAAIAFVHGLVVVTRNTEDFKHVPVTVVNPWILE